LLADGFILHHFENTNLLSAKVFDKKSDEGNYGEVLLPS
jgi:hypothetical protein